jgi:predicted nucleic acid-binding protein
VIVVDASALIEVLLRTPAAASVAAVLGSHASVHAPHLIDVEVAQVVRRYLLSGDIDAEKGAAALSDLRAFPMQRHPHDFLLPRVWQLRHNLNAYDAIYVALAEGLDMPFFTRDARLRTAAQRHSSLRLL